MNSIRAGFYLVCFRHFDQDVRDFGFLVSFRVVVLFRLNDFTPRIVTVRMRAHLNVYFELRSDLIFRHHLFGNEGDLVRTGIHVLFQLLAQFIYYCADDDESLPRREHAPRARVIRRRLAGQLLRFFLAKRELSYRNRPPGLLQQQLSLGMLSSLHQYVMDVIMAASPTRLASFARVKVPRAFPMLTETGDLDGPLIGQPTDGPNSDSPIAASDRAVRHRRPRPS